MCKFATLVLSSLYLPLLSYGMEVEEPAIKQNKRTYSYEITHNKGIYKKRKMTETLGDPLNGTALIPLKQDSSFDEQMRQIQSLYCNYQNQNNSSHSLFDMVKNLLWNEKLQTSQEIRSDIIHKINHLMMQQKGINGANHAELIEIAKTLDAATLEMRLQIHGQENLGFGNLPKEVLSLIFDRALMESSPRKVLDLLTVSKSFSKLLMLVPLDLSFVYLGKSKEESKDFIYDSTLKVVVASKYIIPTALAGTSIFGMWKYWPYSAAIPVAFIPFPSILSVRFFLNIFKGPNNGLFPEIDFSLNFYKRAGMYHYIKEGIYTITLTPYILLFALSDNYKRCILKGEDSLKRDSKDFFRDKAKAEHSGHKNISFTKDLHFMDKCSEAFPNLRNLDLGIYNFDFISSNINQFRNLENIESIKIDYISKMQKQYVDAKILSWFNEEK